MATNKYSLADYQIIITLPNNETLLNKVGLSANVPIVVGGAGENGLDGSFVGSIKISRTNAVWKTEGDNTGSWIHNKNLDRTGKVSVDIYQVSDQILQFAMICNAYQNVQDAIGGLTIEVKNAYDSSLPSIATCFDCLIEKVPDQDFGDTAKTQSWGFTCGRVMIYNG